MTEAIVLGKEPAGEFDARVFLFTPLLGKVSAKVTSARKITSKLSPHLEPLSRVRVRLVEKGGFQLVDVLSERRLPFSDLGVLRLLLGILPERYPDRELWAAVERGNLSFRGALQILGVNSSEACCGLCGERPPQCFLLRDSTYFCERCLPPSVRPEAYVVIRNW